MVGTIRSIAVIDIMMIVMMLMLAPTAVVYRFPSGNGIDEIGLTSLAPIDHGVSLGDV